MIITQDAKFTGEVFSVKPKRSPLIQEGFEIPTTNVVERSDSRRLEILKEKTEGVSFSVNGEILAEIQEAEVD